jgi:hypothetical protein
MHYSGEIVIDADYSEDMKLPFKTHDTDCCLTVVTELPVPIEVVHKAPASPAKEYLLINEHIPSSQHLFSVFQPPRY